MRATIHLVTADDCLLLRPLCQPVLDGELRRHRDHAPRLRDVDLAPVLAARRRAARRASRDRRRALGRALEAEFPALDGGGDGLRRPQPPRPRPGAATRRVAAPRPGHGDDGRVVAGSTTRHRAAIEDVVERYLAAFGPARPADLATWSRLTGFREILDGMRARAADVPRRPGPRAVRRARRATPRPGRAGARAVPARVRQRRAVPRRPHPLHARRRRRAGHRRPGARHRARRRVARRHVVDGGRRRTASR